MFQARLPEVTGEYVQVGAGERRKVVCRPVRDTIPRMLGELVNFLYKAAGIMGASGFVVLILSIWIESLEALAGPSLRAAALLATVAFAIELLTKGLHLSP